MAQIPDLIRQLAGNNNYNDNSIYEAEVTSIDNDKRHVYVSTINGPYVQELKASLMTTIDDGFVLIPQIGSTVYIMTNPLINPFIIHYGAVQTVIMTSSQTVQLNSNEYGGIAKIKELTDKINTLENAMNNLINKFNLHQHPAFPGPITPTDVDTDSIQITTVKDLENPSVVHGPASEEE